MIFHRCDEICDRTDITLNKIINTNFVIAGYDCFLMSAEIMVMIHKLLCYYQLMLMVI